MFKVNQQKTKTKLNLSFLAKLLRTIEITEIYFSLLILKEYEAIIHSQTLFWKFKISIFCSSFLFSRSEFLLCYQNSSFSFFKKLNLLSSTIPITWSILSSFISTFTDLCLKISHILIFQLLIWYISFSVAFSTTPYNCRVSSSSFLLLFFFIDQFHFFVTLFYYLHRFWIHIPNYLLWLLTFICSLFSRLLIFFSFSASLVSILDIQFFGLASKVSPYPGLLLYSGKVEKCSFLTLDLP